MKSSTRIIILSILVTTISAYSKDNYHFYRTPFFFEEARLNEKGLSSFDVGVMAGSTCKGRNACEETVNILNIFGPENMHVLGKSVPEKDPLSQEAVALIMLERAVGRDCFAQLEYNGKFKIIEMMFTYTQNLECGIFFQLALPYRKVELTDVCWCDLTPEDCPCPNTAATVWNTFLSLYDNILAQYDLCACGYTKKGIGDFSAALGWSCNYEGIDTLDYIDIALKAGVLTPTAKDNCINNAFDIPFGYNGHTGIFATIDLGIGMYDWFSVGMHASGIGFFDHKREVRMKSDTEQNGFIKLTKGTAKENLGSIWDLGTFIKADHFANGLSLLFAYSFQKQQKSMLSPSCYCGPLDPEVVNCDSMLAGWSMHTIHFMIDYDFTQENQRFGPRIGGFYNLQVGGKNVFQTSTGGGSFGLDIAFCF